MGGGEWVMCVCEGRWMREAAAKRTQEQRKGPKIDGGVLWPKIWPDLEDLKIFCCLKKY